MSITFFLEEHIAQNCQECTLIRQTPLSLGQRGAEPVGEQPGAHGQGHGGRGGARGRGELRRGGHRQVQAGEWCQPGIRQQERPLSHRR